MMFVRKLKKLIGSFVVVTWQDPQTKLRTTLQEMIKTPLATIRTNGKLRAINKGIIFIQHEEADDEEDITAIPIRLVTEVTNI